MTKKKGVAAGATAAIITIGSIAGALSNINSLVQDPIFKPRVEFNINDYNLISLNLNNCSLMSVEKEEVYWGIYDYTFTANNCKLDIKAFHSYYYDPPFHRYYLPITNFDYEGYFLNESDSKQLTFDVVWTSEEDPTFGTNYNGSEIPPASFLTDYLTANVKLYESKKAIAEYAPKIYYNENLIVDSAFNLTKTNTLYFSYNDIINLFTAKSYNGKTLTPTLNYYDDFDKKQLEVGTYFLELSVYDDELKIYTYLSLVIEVTGDNGQGILIQDELQIPVGAFLSEKNIIDIISTQHPTLTSINVIQNDYIGNENKIGNYLFIIRAYDNGKSVTLEKTIIVRKFESKENWWDQVPVLSSILKGLNNFKNTVVNVCKHIGDFFKMIYRGIIHVGNFFKMLGRNIGDFFNWLMGK